MTNDLASQCSCDPFDSNIVVRRANASRGKHDIELLVKITNSCRDHIELVRNDDHPFERNPNLSEFFG